MSVLTLNTSPSSDPSHHRLLWSFSPHADYLPVWKYYSLSLDWDRSLICAHEVNYTMHCSSFGHTPLALKTKPTWVPCLWVHGRICSLVLLFPAAQRPVARPCSFWCALLSLQDFIIKAFLIDRILQNRLLLFCLKLWGGCRCYIVNTRCFNPVIIQPSTFLWLLIPPQYNTIWWYSSLNCIAFAPHDFIHIHLVSYGNIFSRVAT